MTHSLLARLRCWLFHARDTVWWPIHHSWGFKCNRCGREGISYD
jgi:hypothetical protein